MERLVRALQAIRIVDENRQLSLTTIAFGIGCFCVVTQRPVSLPELLAFAIGTAGYHAKKLYRHRTDHAVMQAAHEAGLAKLDAEKEIALQQQSQNAGSLTEKVTQLERKVTEYLTPDQQEKLRSILRRNS